MATISDPDLLRLRSVSAGIAGAGEVFIKPADLTIQLASTTQSASSQFTAAEGVTLQALYSFLKEQWKNNDTDDFFKYRFPMEAITAEQFEFINGWTPAEDTTRTYIRTGGWSEKKLSASVTQTWMGVITLGSISSNQTAYNAWFDTSTSAYLTTATNFNFSGPVNEPVKIFGDADNGNFDYTEKQLNLFIRPTPTGSDDAARGFTFGNSDTAAIGASAGVTNQVYRFPLTSVVDLKITKTDTQVASIITAAGLEIRFDQTSLTSAQLPIELNGGPFNFEHVIQSTQGDSANLTPSQVYQFVQYSLRQGTDIDADTGTRTGQLTEPLVQFVGDVVETLSINSGTEGVLIDNFNTSETANIKMRDNSNSLKSFPTVAAGTITFNQNLIDDPATRYWMFYTTASSGQSVWPGATAKLVPDYSGTDITGYLHSVVATPTTGSASAQEASVTSGGFTLTHSAASTAWTADDYNDKILKYVSGGSSQNVGYYNILDTTTTTVVVDRAFEETDSAVNFQILNRNSGTISWDFNYDNAIIRDDANASNDAAVTVVALGLDDAQYVNAGFTITSASGQSFSIVAPLERNYNDPV